MSITATELKLNLAKYLLLSATEDIYITKNGKIVSKLTNPFQERVDIAKSLFGILPADITLEEAQKIKAEQDAKWEPGFMWDTKLTTVKQKETEG